MLFPVLNKLRTTYPDYVIDNFDKWLGTRRLATLNTLSPLQFSIDTEIEDEIAISIFFRCCEPDCLLLKASWHLECPLCGATLLVTDTYSTIDTNEYFCEDCSSSGPIFDENIIVWFSRLQEPDADSLKCMHQYNYLGNSSGGEVTSAAAIKQCGPWDKLIADI